MKNLSQISVILMKLSHFGHLRLAGMPCLENVSLDVLLFAIQYTGVI